MVQLINSNFNPMAKPNYGYGLNQILHSVCNVLQLTKSQLEI